ncbi:MAG: hypothetical protein KJ955_07055 [Nanoarchaeota archaeon]|nr:hypothetical protein [Nanoarchaeota archaeon]
MNRKASFDLSRKALYFILVLFVVTFIFLYMHAAIIKQGTKGITHRGSVSGQLIAAEALTSSRCFAYYDEELDRAYPGVIDFDKIKAGLKLGCLQYAQNPFKISIYDAPSIFRETPELHASVARGGLNPKTEKATRNILIAERSSGEARFFPGKMEIEVNDYYVDIKGLDEKRQQSEPTNLYKPVEPKAATTVSVEGYGDIPITY